MKASKITLIFIWLFIAPLQAWDLLEVTGPHQFSLGPECYHIKRERQGGTFQKGCLYGGYFNYQRLRWNGLYAEGDLSYASGHLNGKTARGASLKSKLDELWIEGALGWTVKFCLVKPFSLTPYAGYGYFRSINDFRKPSPLLCQFKDEFQFPLLGIYGLIYWDLCLSFGANFKARWMQGATEKVTGDDELGDIKMDIGDNWLYELQFPITYTFPYNGYWWNANLIPFWEKRNFGGREGYPMDFIQTLYTVYGLRLLVGIDF